MIALLLEAAGLDPTALIGGVVSSFQSNARFGRSRYLVPRPAKAIILSCATARTLP